MQKVKLFKIRCSAIGSIMSQPKTKADKGKGLLSDTTKNYVHEWLTQELYGVRKDINSKYLEKGIDVEDAAIEYLSDNSDFGMLFKNEESFENDFMTGTPDLILSDLIIDIKSSWDCFTFPLFDEKIKNKNYIYQLQGYMNLTKRKKAILAYVLMNTPDYISEFGHDYNDLAPELRIKIFNIEYDESIIDSVKERVIQIRNYIESIGYEQSIV